jgi:ABC-type transporter Mla subunit MlaD
MGRGSEKRATRKRVADVSAAAREDAEDLKRATTRRLAKLEKDLAAARRTEERHRSRLAAASAEADQIRSDIAGLVRHASEPAVGGAKRVGHAAGDLLEGAADTVADAAGAVADAAGAVRDAAGSVVGAARRAVRSRSDAARVLVPAKPAVTSRPAKAPVPARAGAAKPAAARPPAPAKPATPRPRRPRPTTPPATGPDNG